MRIANNQNGFTLLEIIVVTALLALMSTILYGTLNGFIKGKNLVMDGRAAHRAAISVFTRLNNELLSRAAEEIEVDGNKNSGFKSTRYLLGTNKNIGDADADEITFISDGGGQELFSGSNNPGRVQITYRLEKVKSQDLDFDQEETYVLVRDEQAIGLPTEKLRNESRMSFPIANNVKSFNIRYLTKATWKDSWNVNFPEAIEFKLQFQKDEGSIESFLTAISISPRESPP